MRTRLTMVTLAGLVLSLAACQSRPPQSDAPPAPPPPTPTVCEASNANFALGQHATNRLVERARLASGAETARVLHPNEAVTMEFNATRLNLEVNEGNLVQNVRCG